jgi:hypothetical protein
LTIHSPSWYTLEGVRLFPTNYASV